MNDEVAAPTFVDLFAGAGGLSLGLMAAGLRGLFAVEREVNAFATLRSNLIDGRRDLRYEWPRWLPREPIDLGDLIELHRSNLEKLRGKVDILAGGPPCQGFSQAGRRRSDDPRNRLFELYAQMAQIVQPAFLVFENVPWIAVAFDKLRRKKWNPDGVGRPVLPFSEKIAKRLGLCGYDVVGLHERALEFGVPQDRTRYLMLGVRRDLQLSLSASDLRGMLMTHRDELLATLGLEWPVMLHEAISDLETARRHRIGCVDSPGFDQVVYGGPQTQYQKLMHIGMRDDEPPNSMRLVNHRPETVARFRKILATCRKDVKLNPADRARLGMGKASTTPLARDKPSKTITSLPDDFIHYSEPRIFTVRECARIQSFPDWFEFRGKYTTGGTSRRSEVPRYTQVANAVPPLLAQVVGRVLVDLRSEVVRRRRGTVPGYGPARREVVLAGRG